MRGSRPGDQPAQLTEDDLEVIADLTALAAELTARGYRTRLDTTATPTPRLTLTHPQLTACHYISVHGQLFCWEPATVPGTQPFSLRPPLPITRTADAVGVITHYWIAVEEESQP